MTRKVFDKPTAASHTSIDTQPRILWKTVQSSRTFRVGKKSNQLSFTISRHLLSSLTFSISRDDLFRKIIPIETEILVQLEIKTRLCKMDDWPLSRGTLPKWLFITWKKKYGCLQRIITSYQPNRVCFLFDQQVGYVNFNAVEFSVPKIWNGRCRWGVSGAWATHHMSDMFYVQFKSRLKCRYNGSYLFTFLRQDHFHTVYSRAEEIKSRFTLLVFSNATGYVKYIFLFIWKSKQPRYFCKKTW